MLRLFRVIRVTWSIGAMVVFAASCWAALGPARGLRGRGTSDKSRPSWRRSKRTWIQPRSTALFNRDQFIVSSVARLLSAGIVAAAGPRPAPEPKLQLEPMVLLLAVAPAVLSGQLLTGAR